MKKLSFDKIYYKLCVLANEIKDNHLDVYSAGTAFYLFISIIPFFIDLFIVIAIVILLVMGVFGKKIIEIASDHLPHLPEGPASWLAAIIDFRVLITLVCLFLLFVFLYTFLPATRLTWIYQTPGAVLCAVAWWLFTKLFSFVVGKFGGFSMYGSMATAIASMLWMYCIMYILFFCSEINNHFARSIINHLKNRRAARQQT